MASLLLSYMDSSKGLLHRFGWQREGGGGGFRLAAFDLGKSTSTVIRFVDPNKVRLLSM